MKNLIILLSILMLVACKDSKESNVVSEVKQPPPEISVEDFVKNSEQRTFRMSPDGSHIAYLAPYKTRMNIHVKAAGSEEVIRVTGVEDRDINNFFWASNDRLVYIKDNAGNENFHLYSIGKEGKDEKNLTPFDGVRAQIIDCLLYTSPSPRDRTRSRMPSSA